PFEVFTGANQTKKARHIESRQQFYDWLVCAARNPRLFAAVPLWNENDSILNGSFRTTAPAHGAMPTQA
ncbi:MAG: hypothetical protein U9Q19_11740, partial [Pseudomonadota bacterium]|nr:hypothetical protein [Pseudomonadota bacterium]